MPRGPSVALTTTVNELDECIVPMDQVFMKSLELIGSENPAETDR